ncbi:hypothetical protein HAX54_030437 [Datura stramonium]|uniref:DAGKc domain-containing protein n=1 Tax=Datura stramonium TaxID=4076 RepID=A0ABS8SB07_DATST|nr:hypothetical protein [Datura stramonium]
MDPTDAEAPVLSDRVQISGTVVPMTLTAGGTPNGLTGVYQFEKDVPGFTVEVIDSLGRPKRLFVLLNPYGGNGSAIKVFLDDVKPLLNDANIHYTLQETKYRLHARSCSLVGSFGYDGVVLVVVNGLLEREDWSSAIKMPLGVIPAGTSNGMAKSLLDSVGESCTAFNATLAIIRGLIADIDIESEKYRWMGRARMDFYAIQLIFVLEGFQPKIEGPLSQSGFIMYLGEVKMFCAPDAKEKMMMISCFSRWLLGLTMKDCPKLSLVTLMSGLNKGGHVRSPHVLYLKVKAFTLEPGSRADDPNKEGIDVGW